MTSWVEMTCPPGWGADRDSLGMWFAWAMDRDYGGASDWEGVTVFVDTEAAANRLAWERWALGVLAGRARWDFDPDHDYLVPMLWYPLGQVGLVITFEGDERRYTVVDDGDEYHWTACDDPVEAIARLAGVMLAACGPKNTDAQSKSGGGQ